jgi:ATP-dependent helicase/nuclease subunit A
MSELPVAPRELVVASAGAGKTYRLSQRIIQLLDGGAAAEEIFASTFTRKAAGEILDRVLLRLADGALDPEAAGSLGLDSERCLELLGDLVRRLHAVNVGTLDSFFQRISRSFSLELGLPVRWALSDGPAETRLRSEAISRLLEQADRGVAVELVRLLQGGQARRGVHDLLLEQVASLHGLYRELDRQVEDPWGFPPEERSREGPVSEKELAEAAEAIARADVPLTGSGAPDRNWVKARDDAAEWVRTRTFDPLLEKGLGKKIVLREPTYRGKSISEPLAAALSGALELVRRELADEVQRRADALGRLLPLYDRRIRELRREAGLYQFEDVTRVLAESGAGGRGDQLHYRLDARIRHILLDEFQDTSLSQWWAIRPLVEEILSGYEGERGVVIVADPKQSIYGWRGGEPRIVEAIRRDFRIPEASLHESWRSAPVVLGFVNQVFGALPGADVLEGEDENTATAWLENFTPHVPAEPLEKLPGHVRVEVGPSGDSARASVRPRILALAARRVLELSRTCPGATVGVLTRTNRAVARLMGELRRLEVDASEEGGVPLADSPAVLSLLALLRMADHPADSVARYQAAHTPVATLVDGFEWRSEAAAARVAAGIRRRLAREGYGPVVGGWVRQLEPRASSRDRRRLRQLAELAFRWDEHATLRPDDFVRWVEEERVEDPAASRIRVMTVHQAKGLQFDMVVLPDLDQSLLGRGGEKVYPYRPAPDAPVTRVYPGMKKSVVALFPALGPAVAQAREARLRDGLSGLYVALTRARFGLHLILAPDPASGPSRATSGARLVREALGATGRIEEGQVLLEEGRSDWWNDPAAPHRVRPRRTPAGRPQPEPAAQVPGSPPGGEPPLVRTRASRRRRRLLPRRTPSELEGGGKVRLERLFHPGGASARREGTVIHEWLRELEWVGQGLPSEVELRRIARAAVPGFGEVEELAAALQRWVEVPEVWGALSRDSYPDGVVLHRERLFLRRDGDRLVQGVVDRLVVAPGREGSPGRAWILDYKTDRIEGGPEGDVATMLRSRVELYRPQLEAYRRAVAGEERLPLERVEASLIFLRPGRVVKV